MTHVASPPRRLTRCLGVGLMPCTPGTRIWVEQPPVRFRSLCTGPSDEVREMGPRQVPAAALGSFQVRSWFPSELLYLGCPSPPSWSAWLPPPGACVLSPAPFSRTVAPPVCHLYFIYFPPLFLEFYFLKMRPKACISVAPLPHLTGKADPFLVLSVVTVTPQYHPLRRR